MAQAPTYDTEINKAPALRISHVVRGRVNDGSRVRYLVDPEGNSEERAIPEDVVLLRWRRRAMEGHTFHGCGWDRTPGAPLTTLSVQKQNRYAVCQLSRSQRVANTWA